MAVVSLSTVTVALVLTPLLYFLFWVFTFLKDAYFSAKCVLQWSGEKVHWLYGNLHQHPAFEGLTEKNKKTLGDDTMKWMLDQTTKYPRGYYFFGHILNPVFTANHPACAKPFLKGSGKDPKPMSATGYKYIIPWLGDGLVMSRGQKWYRNRRLLTPAFHFEVLKPYVNVYNTGADVLLDKMRAYAKTGESFAVVHNVSKCTMDILLQCAFSQQSNCQTTSDSKGYFETIERISREIMDRIFNPLMVIDFIYLNLTAAGRAHQKNVDFVHQIGDTIIKQRRKQLNEKSKNLEDDNQPKRKYLDFLDILIAAKDDEGKGLTDLEIRNEVDTFLFAGHDTTASSISWTLYALAKHKECQRKVQEELDDVLKDRESDHLEWEDLSKLKYLAYVLKESLRMHPPLVAVSRQMENDIEVDGRMFRAGTQADIDIYALHHHPDFWDKPMEFNPERFFPENSQNRDPYCYIPFAAGPRNCIGQNFALNEDKVIISRILYNFDIELDPDHEVNYGLDITTKPMDEIKLKLKLRR